ncbi:hypothetical protein LCGC14_0648070 [marine sediment metagenome]|uniref:Uncharacterized protein n=1 Tax=marine sediment metagenome TaxID=412755 RepID=A0A0F9R2E1_9ZZZZ
MPPLVWAAYINNLSAHLAETTILQAQAAQYGASVTIPKVQSQRSTWYRTVQRLAEFHIDQPSMGSPAQWKAKMLSAGIAVKSQKDQE